MTFWTATIAPAHTVLSLALLEGSVSEGSTVEVVWGEDPGDGTGGDANLAFPHIRATVYPSPYNEYARTAYRKS
jgi:hypothetical protein